MSWHGENPRNARFIFILHRHSFTYLHLTFSLQLTPRLPVLPRFFYLFAAPSLSVQGGYWLPLHAMTIYRHVWYRTVVCDSLRWEVTTPGASRLLGERWCMTSCLPVSQHNPTCKLPLLVFHTNSFVLRNMPQPLLILIRLFHFLPDVFFFVCVNAGHTPSCFFSPLSKQSHLNVGQP